MNDPDSQTAIVDSFGRVHDSLRVSVTDRCNIRCFYCMPEVVKFLPHRDILTFEELVTFVKICADLGVNKIRLTGGEPLVRSQLWRLIAMLVSIPGIQQVALTTNGLLLADQAQKLKDAGLSRLNISLDSVNPKVFERITRRRGLANVLAGIDAAKAAGFEHIRLNAISVKGISETEILPLAQYARENQLELRFIEFMPLDADGKWEPGRVLFGSHVKEMLERSFCPLELVSSVGQQQAAVDYRFSDGKGVVGFINSVSEPFCSNCNRMRITAEGKFMNCLFSQVEWDIRELLRSGADSGAIENRIRECIAAKKAGHGTDSIDFQRPLKAMYQIGG